MKTCPMCGGEHVEELLLVWRDCATGESDGDEHPAALYSERFWCRDCDDHPSHLIETDAA